jgi:hypothetical protein
LATEDGLDALEVDHTIWFKVRMDAVESAKRVLGKLKWAPDEIETKLNDEGKLEIGATYRAGTLEWVFKHASADVANIEREYQ